MLLENKALPEPEPEIETPKVTAPVETPFEKLKKRFNTKSDLLVYSPTSLKTVTNTADTKELNEWLNEIKDRAIYIPRVNVAIIKGGYSY